jgi:HSP20 family protein
MKIEEENLIISATKPTADDKDTVKFLKKEIELNNYKRIFLLSNKIDKTKINASYNNGILVVSLPKKDNVSFNINVD